MKDILIYKTSDTITAMSKTGMSTQTSNHLKLGIFLTLLFLSMLMIKPDTMPYPWFDEGWTLVTARNWTEQGKYALQLGTEWVSAEQWHRHLL